MAGPRLAQAANVSYLHLPSECDVTHINGSRIVAMWGFHGTLQGQRLTKGTFLIGNYSNDY